MSSRTSAGKKKHQSGLNESTQNLVRPQVVQVRLNQPPPQIIEIKQNEDKEKSPSIWTIFGESSLILAVVTAILFGIGWAYVSNWYSYYGLGLEQVNIPFQQVLIQSLPATIISFVGIPFIIGIYILFRSTLGKSLPRQPFTLVDWQRILFIYLFFLLFIVISRFVQVGGLKGLGALPSELYYLFLLIAGLMGLFSYSTVPINNLAAFLFDKFGWSNKTLGAIQAIVTGAVFITINLSLSATLAIEDASVGKTIGGGSIQEVLLNSPKKLNIIQDLEQSCVTKSDCNYGPFGVIVISDSSFFLVKWVNLKPEKFQRNPGLCVMPRSDKDGAYFLVPVPSSTPTISLQLAPSRTATPDLTPTATTNLTPVIIVTSTSTSVQQ